MLGPAALSRRFPQLGGVLTGTIAAVLFAFSWLFRFNDPGGSFAGLTDDHFFYLVRGWQILFGDLPVRDFVDHGAPLYFYAAAAVQSWFGRGTVSEVAFAVTVLSAAAAGVFWLAARASGSNLYGAAAALVHVLLQPRFYNYPKILVYAVAIPLLWRFADRPGPWLRFWLALTTVVAFLFRHDHGVFVAIAFATLLLMLRELHWRQRLRHALAFGGLVLSLLAPYLLFIQVNGGLPMYLRDASTWAARDRDRAPVVWPGLFDQSHESGAIAALVADGPLAVVRDNFVAWMYYMELALPLCALLALACFRDALRPEWPRAVSKLTTVAVLGIVLNAGFLRSPLAARLADPSVPHTILLAWLAAAAVRAVKDGRSMRTAMQPWSAAIRTGLVLVVGLFAFVLGVGLSHDFHERLDSAALSEGIGKGIERVGVVRRQLHQDWQLHTWRERPDRPDLITLALYLEECVGPNDRVLIQPYMPQVLALSRRAFAGGHADLRPGFFNSPEAQQLTVSRLERQSVPIVLLDTGDSYRNFRHSFPHVTEYLDRQYTPVAVHLFDRRFEVQLLVRRGSPPRGRFALLDWPCF